MHTPKYDYSIVNMWNKSIQQEIDDEILNRLLWKNGHPPCPKCKKIMGRGKAIRPNTEERALYICAQPLINSRTLELIDCWKCPRCGHSEEFTKGKI